jgi:hypothetical protein
MASLLLVVQVLCDESSMIEEMVLQHQCVAGSARTVNRMARLFLVQAWGCPLPVLRSRNREGLCERA